jgi:hypothetical protein
MSRFFEKVRRMRPVVTFAADGSVAALTGFDSISFELEKTFPDEAAIIALVTQSYTMFTPKGFKEFLEMQFKVLPSSPVKAKGSWKSDVSGSVMGIASEAKNTYKVVTVEGDKITTEVSTNLRMKLPQALIATSGGRGGRGGMMGMGMPGGMGGGMCWWHAWWHGWWTRRAWVAWAVVCAEAWVGMAVVCAEAWAVAFSPVAEVSR